MKVMIIKNINDNVCNIFHKTLTEKLLYYGIEINIINNINFNCLINNIDKNTVLVVYNNKIDLQNEKVKKLMEKAKNEKTKIFPVAFSKETRIPIEIISEYQSFDIYDQLRCRDLKEDVLENIKIPAQVFSRIILSEVLPTLCRREFNVFLSHKRLDGEEITARLCDTMNKINQTNGTQYRDLAKISVGQNAQKEINIAMENIDVFVYIQTKLSANAPWIEKELYYAVVRRLPIIWVSVDNAHENNKGFVPSEKPQFILNSTDFENEEKITKIADAILDKAFEMMLLKSMVIIDYISPLEKLFDKRIETKDKDQLSYKISIERNGYRYPQRNINQYFQIYGRRPHEEDYLQIEKNLQKENIDSIALISDKVVNMKKDDKIVIDNIEDFYYTWKRYINKERNDSNMEIVLSGAFPDGEEAYKQCLTDALVVFGKAILKENYILTFGAHPTFQKLFFDICKEIFPNDYKSKLNMYISTFFDTKENIESNYNDDCTLKIIDKIDCENNLDSMKCSLTEMRKKMIQREEVKALICIGGKRKKDSLEEGIREEINFAREYHIPVFIIGSAGGCANVVGNEYKEQGWSNLNNAPEKLNNELLVNPDYFSLVQEVLDYLRNN